MWEGTEFLFFVGGEGEVPRNAMEGKYSREIIQKKEILLLQHYLQLWVYLGVYS